MARIRGFLDEFHVRALLANGKLTEAGRWLEESESDQPALHLEFLLNLGRFDDALLLAREELANLQDMPSATLIFQAVQSAVLGNDPDMAEQWLRAVPESDGGENFEFEVQLARALAATISGDPAESVQQKFATALEAAELQYSELDQMRAGSAFVIYLVREGDLDSASETMGRFSTLAQHDYRAARASLALYQALGHQSLEAEAESMVGKLAGERQSSLPVVF